MPRLSWVAWPRVTWPGNARADHRYGVAIISLVSIGGLTEGAVDSANSIVAD